MSPGFADRQLEQARTRSRLVFESAAAISRADDAERLWEVLLGAVRGLLAGTTTAALERCGPDSEADIAAARENRTDAVGSGRVFPIRAADGTTRRVLRLAPADGESLDDDDVLAVAALVEQAGTALSACESREVVAQLEAGNDELRRELGRALRERDLLLEMEQLLSRTDSLDQFLDGTLAGVMRETGAAGGAILLREETSGRLTLRAARCASGSPPTLGGTPSSDAAVVAAVDRGDSLVVDTSRDDSPVSVLSSARPHSLVAVPLPGEHGAIGALELRDRVAAPFASSDLHLLELIAANLSTGVELAQARHERERTARLAAVGRTLSNVLHDIRTPMTIISGYAQLMPTVESVDERARYAAAIVRQFDHVQAMIGELLAFVRGESQLLLQRVMVEPFFVETVDVLRTELAARRVALKLDVRERGTARLDTAKITRMVHNLARNAADALAPRGGGTFEITVERQGNELVLGFRDDGPGIPESIRGQLFESFVTAGKPGGTGLGLAIVKRAVEEHHGTISVETGPSGTRFEVRLPVSGPSYPSSRVPPPYGREGTGAGLPGEKL